jgi:carotenoid cleavage dioxygenase-like enzyme
MLLSMQARSFRPFTSAAKAIGLILSRSNNFGTKAWVPLDGISAHTKVDEATGELLFFNYSKHAPYMHYGVVGPDNKLKHYIPVPLAGPRLPHDMAFTKNYAHCQRYAALLEP